MKSFHGEAKNATQLSLELEEKRVDIEKLRAMSHQMVASMVRLYQTIHLHSTGITPFGHR